MQLELSDLLREAKADAPPPRYDVTDVVAAGRRLRTRRRLAWTSAGTAAVVLAVAGAVTVPQVFADREDGSVSFAPAAQAPPPFEYPRALIAGNIQSYRVGALTVTGTVHVTPGYQVAEVVGPDDQSVIEDAAGARHRFTQAPGLVTVFRPGAFNAARFSPGEPIKINGRDGRISAEHSLAWQYADNAWAVVSRAAPGSFTLAQLVAIASGLRSGPAKVPAVAMKLSYVPDGFKLAAAGTADWQLSVTMPGESYLRLIKGDFPYRNLTEPFDNPVVHDKQLPMIQLTIYPTWYGKYSPPAGQPRNAAFCQSESLCYRATDDNKYQLEANGGGTLPDADLLKLVKGITFDDPGDVTTWTPATSAVG